MIMGNHGGMISTGELAPVIICPKQIPRELPDTYPGLSDERTHLKRGLLKD
jgi:hypothetical protein